MLWQEGGVKSAAPYRQVVKLQALQMQGVSRKLFDV